LRRAWPVVSLLVACGVVACSGDDDRPAPAPDVEGGASSGGSQSKSGSSSVPDAGEEDPGSGGAESGDAGHGGAGGDGLVYETAGAPAQAPAGACDPMMMPGDDQSQSVGVSGVKLLSMTPDERSAVVSTAGSVHVADRSAADQPFSALEVTLPAGYSADTGVALSADGLKLILVSDDGSGFGELSRAARGQAFGAEADVTRFAAINGLKGTTGRSVGWPVLSSDEKELYYVSYFGQALVVQSSAGQGGAFAYGMEIDEFTLGGVEGEYKLLTGISSDQRAIFFFDEATGHSMALFRSRPNAPFYDPVDLGERDGVAPNASCSRLYSSVAGNLVFQALE
jgi:hypothetical protein